VALNAVNGFRVKTITVAKPESTGSSQTGVRELSSKAHHNGNYIASIELLETAHSGQMLSTGGSRQEEVEVMTSSG
jgi:hypothetical protein